MPRQETQGAKAAEEAKKAETATSVHFSTSGGNAATGLKSTTARPPLRGAGTGVGCQATGAVPPGRRRLKT
jgi:hypothetical protein